MSNHAQLQCRYHGKLGPCQDQALVDSQFCFWHDPDVDKSGTDVSEALAERAQTGVPMEGFLLRKANLDGVNLVCPKSHQGYQLVNSDLSRASLKNAHLYRLDLSGSCLLKVNLNGANLNNTCLKDTNLLAVNFKNSQIDNIEWGDSFLQERQAKQEPDRAVDLYEEAEEISRNIRRHCEEIGMMRTAGRFYYRERVFQRMQMPLYSRSRALSWLVDKVSGYGEAPLRVVFCSVMLIILCSFFYLWDGIQDGAVLIQFDGTQSLSTMLSYWFDCLYFSVVTFTTLGYGDLSPLGFSRIVAAGEAFIGNFSLALFVVLVAKKIIR